MHPEQFLLVLQALEHSGAVDPSASRGCSAEEIAILERTHGVCLPRTYRAFLSVMGHGGGGVFDHDHVEADYGVAMRLTDHCRRDGSRKFRLPADAVVILDRMGDHQQFIRCHQDDDSPVWGVNVWDSKPVRAFDSVLDWLSGWGEEAQMAKAMLETMRRRRGPMY